jgi:hypothetical protein
MANAETITDTLPVATDDRNIPPLSPAAALWQIAVAEYEQAKAANDKALTDYNEAEARYFDEISGQPKYHEDYFQRTDHSHDERFKQAQIAIAIRDYWGRNNLSAEERAAIDKEAREAVDGFAAQIKDRAERSERHNLAALDQAVNATGDALASAEHRLYATPAPDSGVMLAKLGMLSATMAEYHDNWRDEIAAIRDDARRLFGSK